MRQNLGSLVGVLFLLFSTMLFAEAPYVWSLKTSKSRVYVNEAVEIEYTCSFQDQAYLHVIEFTPAKETPEYRLLSLGVVEKVIDGKRSDTYRYVMFPKRAGEKQFAFNALMRKTTKASIENSVIGRDNVEDYAFDDTMVDLPAVVLDVLGHSEKMTGVFSLVVTLDKKRVKAYEPVHVDVRLKGEGDFDQMQDYNLSIDGVKIFSEPGEKRYRLTKSGFKGEWEQKFSLVGSKSFQIPAFELRYFDIVQKRQVVLRSEDLNVEVEAAYSKEELLDTPEERASSWWQWSYLNYLFTFTLGMLAYHYGLKYKDKLQKRLPSREETQGCQSVTCLLSQLAMSGDSRYDALIKKYETLGKRASLSALKKELKALNDTIKNS